MKNKILFLIILYLCLPCTLGFLGTSQQAKADSIMLWKGIIFGPYLDSIVGGRAVFFPAFENTVKDLKSHGVNTIVLDMVNHSYHFKYETDNALCNTSAGGHNFDDARRMAQIVRQYNMNLVISTRMLTHQYGEGVWTAHPEYMLAGNDWQSGKLYTAEPWNFVKYNNITYRCIADHTSNLSNVPPSAAYWVQDASNTMDPFNILAEFHGQARG